MKPQLPHWVIALLVAAGLHVGLAVAWVGLQKEPALLPVDAGGLDVVVAIAPAFAPPAALEQPAAEAVPVETVMAAMEPISEPVVPEIEPVAEPEPVVDAVTEPPVTAEPESVPVEALPDELPEELSEELPIEQPPIAVAEAIPDIPLPVVLPPVEPKPKSVEKTKPKPPQTKMPKAKPPAPVKPKIQPVNRVRPVVREVVTPPPDIQVANVQPVPAATKAAAGASVDASTNSASSTPAEPSRSAEQRASEQGYYGRLARRIAKHKRYPRAAKRERSTGTVVVTFTVAANGRLQQSRVSKSSGDPRLDEAALKMLKRASPFPPLPVSMGRRSVTITLPVEFALRR